ncbi:CopD family protein (plasmid) [Skermanella sp. TT6]|uniref:CopD family protein n=1 Tax=Skermanella cutis TaxID=2775420 RepID=A0ABX7BG86_9PROT|nr:CopD family protein [Skermanella sp. TT6]QQP93382.1 CopD family protein [Skermanella sp. TT6]
MSTGDPAGRHRAGPRDGIARSAGLLMLVLASLVHAPAALAHAVVVETGPEDGARLDAPPREAWLRFNEPVRPVTVRVLAAGGGAVTGPEAVTAEGETIRIALPEDLPEGGYVLSYRVTSADGHPVAGSIVFAAGTEAPPAAVTEPSATDGTAVAAAAVRALHYAALLFAAGGGLFLAFVPARRDPLGGRLTPALCLGAAVAALTGMLGIGLAGANLQGAPLGSLLQGGTWQTGLATSVGFAGLLALAGLLAGTTGLALDGRRGDAALVVGALLASASLAVTGHAATAPPRWLSQPLVFAHALAAIYWVGALWPLIVVLRTVPPDEAIRAVQRFSRLAVPAVAVLALAGTVISMLQLGDAATVATTAYGRIWLAKAMLVAILLALAAINRQRLTPALAEGRPAAARRLARGIRIELLAVAGIILATASFPLTPPPRALLAQEAGMREGAGENHRHDGIPEAAAGPGRPDGYTAVVTVGNRTAVIAVEPARPGRNSVKAYLTGPGDDVLSPLEATVELAHPDAGIEPISRPLAVSAQGTVAGDVDLPFTGNWTLALDVLVTDFEKAVFRTRLIVKEGR